MIGYTVALVVVHARARAGRRPRLDLRDRPPSCSAPGSSAPPSPSSATRRRRRSMRVFAYSITYVTLLFAALTVDVLVQAADRPAGSRPGRISARRAGRPVMSRPQPVAVRRPSPPAPRDEHHRHRPRLHRPRAAGRRRSARGGVLAAVAYVDHDHRSKGIGRACSSAARSWPSLAGAVVGVLLGIERIDGDGPLLDAGALPQLFVGLPRRARLRRARPAAARRRRRRRAAAARRPLAGLPPPRRRRLLGLARRARARDRRRSPTTAAPAAATRTWSTCSSPATACSSSAWPPPAGSRRHLRAHHPGPGHEHAPGAAVLVVGAGRLARSAARAAGRCSASLDLPVRRPPATPGRCSAATPASAVDRLRPHPAGDLPVRPPGVRLRRRADPGRRSARGCRCAASCSPASPSSASPPSPASPSSRSTTCRGPAAASTSTTSARSSTTSSRTPCSRCCRCSASHRAGASAPSPPSRRAGRRRGPRITAAFVFAFFGLGMILVGMLGGALAADRRPRPAGHRVRGGRRSCTSSTAACSAALGGIAYWARSGPGARCPDEAGHRPRPARRAGHRARLAAVLRRRVRRPAGGVGDVRLRRPGRAVEHRSSPPATRLMFARRPRLRRPRAAGPPRDGDGVAGDDPWDGQTLEWVTSSPAPSDNFPRCRP